MYYVVVKNSYKSRPENKQSDKDRYIERPNDNEKRAEELAFSRIVCPIGNSRTVKYVVKWYSYTLQGDIVENLDNIRQYFFI